MGYQIDNEYQNKKINLDGIVPLERNNRDRWNSAYQNIQAGQNYLNIPAYRTQNPGFIKDSLYNEFTGNISLLTPEEYYNSLLKQQSTWSALGNALVNNVVIAGTTFIQNMVGIPAGVFNAVDDNKFSSMAINPLSKKLVDWQKQVQEQLPIYRGTDYEDKNLWQKMGNGVFWADLIQNLGFTEGAAAAMAVCKYLGAPMMLSAFVGSIGEATVQTVNKYNENIKYKQNLLDQELVNNMSKANSDQERQLFINDRIHKEALIDDDERRAGNVNYIENIGLLTLTNAIEFGQWLQQDYSLARIALKNRAATTVGNGFVKEVQQVSKSNAMLRALGLSTLNASTEGVEEFAQDVFDKLTLFRNSEKFNNVLFNDEYRDKATNMLDTFVKGLSSTLSDKQTSVDVMSGFITGFIGAPTLSKNVFENGIIANVRNTNRAVENTNAIIDEINRRLEQDPMSKSTYENLVRQLMIQDEQNLALENDDQKSFKDAQSFSYISDLINYDDIGLLYLKEQELESYRNMSDEELEQLIRPINDPKSGQPFTIEEARDNLNKRIDFMEKHLDFFKKNKKSFLSRHPDVSNETLHQAMFLTTLVDSWRNRMNDIGDIAYDQYVKLWDRIVESEKDLIIHGISQRHNGRYRHKKVNDQRVLKPYNKNRSLRDNEVVVQKQDNNTYTIVDSPESLSENDNAYVARKSDLKRVFESKEEQNLFDRLKKMLNISDNIPDSEVRYTLETTPFSKNEFLRLLSVFPDFAKNQIDLMNEQRYGFTEEDKRNFELSVIEYPQLVESVNRYLNDYLEMLSNITKYDIEQKLKTQRVRNEKSKRQRLSFKDLLKSISTVKDFERELRNSRLSEEEKESIINELVGEKHLAAKEYKQMKQYFDKFVEEIQTTPDEEDDGSGEMRLTAQAKKDILDLFKDNYEHSNSLIELSNPESQRINYTQLFPNTPDGAIRKARAQYFTKEAIKQINESDDRFSGLVNPGVKDEGVKQPVKQPLSTSIVLNGTEINTPVYTKPETKEIVFDDTSKQYDDTQSYQPSESQSGGLNEYMRPALPQFVWYNIGQNSILVTFDDYKKRTNGGDYSEIVRYLTSEGAYDYINSGKLLVGNKIEFVVDPKIKYQGQPLIILRSNGHTVGSLNIGNASQYKGLQKLISDIYESYNGLSDEAKNSEYVYQKDGQPFVTHVAQIMNGNIMISKDENGNNIENNIYDILNNDDNGKIIDMPILGVMTLNGIETNGKIDQGKIIQPNSLLLQYGRVFILSPNATGEYVAIPVYTKRLSESEFNLNDQSVRNTIIGQQIYQALRKLYDNSAEDWDKFEQSIHTLANILYLGDVHINTYVKDNNGELLQVNRDSRFNDGFNIDTLRIFKFKTNPNGTYEIDSDGKRIEESMSLVDLDDGSGQDVIDNLINAFMKLNVPIQVNVNTINSIAGEYDYNQGIISSGVLTSNISSINILNAWFTMDYFDETSGTFVAANSPKSKVLPKTMSDYTHSNDSNNIGGVSLDNTFPVEIKGLNGGVYNFDPNLRKVYKDGKDVTSKLSDDFINRIKYMYIIKNNMTQVHSYNDIYIINFGTDNEIYFDYVNQKVITDSKTKQDVRNHVLENLKSTKKYSDFLQQVSDYSRFIVTSDTDSVKTHNISNEDGSETVKYTDVSDVYNPNDVLKIPGNIYHILVSSKKGSGLSSYKNQFYGIFNDTTMSGEQKVNAINSRINKILDTLFVYSTKLSDLFPVNSQLRRKLYLNKSSELTKEWIEWFFSESPLIEEIKGVPRVYNDRYLIEQSFKQFISDILGGKLSEYIQSTGAYIEKNADITSEQKQNRENLAKQYRMNPNNFVVLLRRMNQFIKDLEQQGCKIITTNLKVYHTYEDLNIAGNIDLLLSDNNGNLYIYDFFATRKYWDTKNPTELDLETLQLYSDATIETDRLILLKNMFELQYGIKINDVIAVPFTYNSNSKGILDETPSVKRYLTEDAKYEQSLNYIEVNSYLNSAENYYTFDKQQNNRVIRESAKLNAYVLDSGNNATWRQHTSILIPDTSGLTLGGIAYNVEYALKQVEEPVVQKAEEPVVEKTTEQLTEVKPLEEPTVTIEKKPANPNDSQYTSLSEDSSNDDELLQSVLGDDFGSDRVVDNTITFTPINIERELGWLEKTLPQINKDVAVRIFDRIINSEDQEVWGHFSDSIILLEEGAAEGTVYHEAFHFVFLTIFNESERTLLKNEAMYQFGLETSLNAEEELANAFMEYTLNRNDRGLLPRIKQFFDYLIDLIRVGLGMQPHMQYYFYKINSAKYASNQSINVDLSKVSFTGVTVVNSMDQFRKLTPSLRKQMVEKGWTQQIYDSLSNEEKQQILHCLHV